MQRHYASRRGLVRRTRARANRRMRSRLRRSRITDDVAARAICAPVAARLDRRGRRGRRETEGLGKEREILEGLGSPPRPLRSLCLLCVYAVIVTLPVARSYTPFA